MWGLTCSWFKFVMSQIALLKDRRFVPLFVAQALGGLNDSIFRNALIVLATYGLGTSEGLPPGQVAAIATGLFILPYFLFSTLAGQVADKFDKAIVARLLKLCEVALVVLGAIAFALSSVPMLLGVLFLLGTQSTFLSPVKFAILPQHLETRELIAGNALIEAGTFLAILFGSIIGSLFIDPANRGLVVSAIMIAAAIGGYLASRAIPPAPSVTSGIKIEANVIFATWRMLRYARQNGAVFWGILGIAWFWTLGGLFVSQLAPFTKFAIGGDQTAVTLYLAIFSIGIGAGSLLCNRLLHGAINVRFVPLAILGMSVFAAELWLATRATPAPDGLTSGFALLATVPGARVAVALLLLAACAGLFSVPLYALVQSRSADEVRSRTIAAGNIVIALFMVTGAVVTTTLLKAGWSPQQVFVAAAALNVPVALLLHNRLRAHTP